MFKLNGYFVNEDDDLLQKYKTLWDKVELILKKI